MRYYITPCPAPRQVRSDTWNARPSVLKYRAFRDEVRAQRVEFVSGDCVTFWIPMPRSWSRRKRAEMLGAPHKQKPDLDNLLKALLDAIYDDDSAIWKIGKNQKFWANVGRIDIHRERDRDEQYRPACDQ